MHDIVDIIKNIQTLTASDHSFKILKDFERVLDELDIYVYKNWEDGELLAGPNVNRYSVECKFLWPEDNMPDPEGGARLLDYGCKVTYQKEHLLVPRKVHKPSDFRPGTKKGKIDAHPVWIVGITMPKKLLQDMFQGYTDQKHRTMAEYMKQDQIQGEIQAEAGASQEVPPDTGVSATGGGPDAGQAATAPTM
jgi:hypothetical protein